MPVLPGLLKEKGETARDVDVFSSVLLDACASTTAQGTRRKCKKTPSRNFNQYKATNTKPPKQPPKRLLLLPEYGWLAKTVKTVNMALRGSSAQARGGECTGLKLFGFSGVVSGLRGLSGET